MANSIQVVLTSWRLDWGILLFSVLTCLIYFRGWTGLHRRQPAKYTKWRLVSFMGGVLTIVIAIVSPIDSFANVLLQVHMAQHVLLMMIAPPLLWLGWPALPLLCGLPNTIQKYWLGPFLASRSVHNVARFFVHPVVALLLFVISTWAWHIPFAYQLALSNDMWHSIEHACFIGTALLFWFPIINPEPSLPIWPRWAMIPYLLAADLQNTVFSAIFTFANDPLYSFYPDLGLFGTTLMRDQSAAGALMWVSSAVVYLIPAAFIMKSVLVNKDKLETRVKPIRIPKIVPPSTPSKWYASLALRRVCQGILFCVSIIVILDGLLGPRMAPLNLAGVLPWIWWRGLVIIAILIAGNIFCWACPFMFVRELAKKLPINKGRWPAGLRNKWLAVALFVAWLVLYETLSPWNSPVFTAWIIILYFFFAFVIDAFFRGASFCKWVCPIGQFHFILSILSPFEVQALKKSTCDSCKTHDCIRGNPTIPRVRGCELELFVPTKQGNLDCTFCLDCVRACPHDNVVLAPSFPGTDLVKEDFRGSIGSLQRADYTALMIVVVFGAFANAAGMVAPVVHGIDAVSLWVGASSPKFVTALFVLASAFIVPTFLCVFAKKISRTSFHVAWSLVPLGIAMWSAHLLFHFVTSYGSIVPVTKRALYDIGLNASPEPLWAIASTPTWLLSGELFLLVLGFLASFAICLRLTTTTRERVPWCILNALLLVVGVWILLQPMQMRGMIG
jgi:cytochrome c oxidase assembly factor CtaG